MAHPVRSRGDGSVLRRFGRRGVALGAIAAAMAAASVPALSGCHAAPQIIQAAMTICPPIIEAVLNLPRHTLPEGFEPCGERTWSVRGATVRLCFHCSRDPSEPVFVQFGCGGKYYPVYPAPAQGRPGWKDDALDTGVHLSKLECEEMLLALAEGKADEFRRRVQASIVMPNERLMPSVAGYRSITLTLDGAAFVPDGGDPVRAHAAVGIEGTVEEVAHYAAAVGVRSLEFREGGTAWAIEVCPGFPVAAVFRNGELVESMILFAPGA